MSKAINVDDLVEDVTRAIKLAFARGVEFGGKEMRQHIMEAVEERGIVTHDKIAASIRHYGQRSSWGSVVAAMHAILTKEPNLTVHEIEERGTKLYPDINIRSFSNQLRRYEGQKYKRDVTTDRWSLLEGVTAGP